MEKYFTLRARCTRKKLRRFSGTDKHSGTIHALYENLDYRPLCEPLTLLSTQYAPSRCGNREWIVGFTGQLMHHGCCAIKERVLFLLVVHMFIIDWFPALGPSSSSVSSSCSVTPFRTSGKSINSSLTSRIQSEKGCVRPIRSQYLSRLPKAVTKRVWFSNSFRIQEVKPITTSIFRKYRTVFSANGRSTQVNFAVRGIGRQHPHRPFPALELL